MVGFVLGSSTCDGILTDADGHSKFSERHAKRLRDERTNVVVTPVFSGPIGDLSAHFALAILNTNPDVVYVYDSLVDSDLPDKILDCVKATSGSSTTIAEVIGEGEKQQGIWECGYFVLRRQFITLLVFLTNIDTSGIDHPFHVSDEWVENVLRTFHDGVNFGLGQGTTMAEAINMFVNITFVSVK